MKSHIYAHRFSVAGLCATMTVYPGAATGKSLVVNWNRRPTREQVEAIMPEYMAWKADCFQTLADETGLRIFDLTQTGPDECVARDFEPEAQA